MPGRRSVRLARASAVREQRDRAAGGNSRRPNRASCGPNSAHRRHRDLHNAAAMRADRACAAHPARRRDRAHRIDARTVAEALLRQHVARPRVARADRECRRAIAGHRRAADILQHALCSPDVGAEFCRSSARRPGCDPSRGSPARGPPATMRRTRAGCRSATQPRVKNVALTPARSELLEDAVGVAVLRAGEAVPARARDACAKAWTWK